MDDKKITSLWKILSRIDNYMISTNNKAALLLAFISFFVGGIIIKWADILKMYNSDATIELIVSSLLIICAGASIFSLVKLFQVIKPYLYSHSFPEKYHSKIFFLHIANYKTEADYYHASTEITGDGFILDLSSQIFALSKGISKKFHLLNQAICSILFVILPSLFLMIFCKVYLLLSTIKILNGDN